MNNLPTISRVLVVGYRRARGGLGGAARGTVATVTNAVGKGFGRPSTAAAARSVTTSSQGCPVTAERRRNQGTMIGPTNKTNPQRLNHQYSSAVVENARTTESTEVVKETDVDEEEEITDLTKVKPMHMLDGPTGWPVVGNFLTYLKKENRGKMHEVQARLHKTYGKMFREKWGTNWQVHVSDPATIEVVYRQEGRFPHRPPLEPWVLYRQLAQKPCGLFTAQGTEWHLYRTELSKRILCPHTTKGLIPPISSVADDLVRRIKAIRDREGEMELVRRIPNEMYKWSLEAAGTFLFETRLGCLDDTIPPRTQQFIDATQEMLTSSLYLIIGERLHQKLNTRFWQKHKTAWDTMFQIGKELIDRRIKELLEERKDGNDSAPSNGVFLTYLLANDKITMDQVHSNVTELLVAGTDTMANSFCFVAHLLANHKDVQDKLFEELTGVLEGDDKTITSSALDEMKYLKCVIKEAMRMYPVVTMNCRILDEDIVLNGHLVPKKTLIVVNHYASGHDDDVFPNASQFLPERWMREGTMDGSKHHPFACLPFGFGKRNCAGQRVAKVEMMIALIKVLQQFRLEPYEGVEFKPVLRTLLTPGENVPIRFVDRG